jgi:hypothetical protein
MNVTFTKVDHKRYKIRIDREAGPALVPRFAPGYDDLMPHDLAHFLVEEQNEIMLGVWGQLAAGGGGIFAPAPEDSTLAVKRRARRLGAVGRRDMQRSEALVGLTVHRWESLPHGGSLTFEWPRRLTFDPATSRRGRRRAG